MKCGNEDFTRCRIYSAWAEPFTFTGRSSALPAILRVVAKIGRKTIGCTIRTQESLLRVVRTVGIAKSEIAKSRGKRKGMPLHPWKKKMFRYHNGGIFIHNVQFCFKNRLQTNENLPITFEPKIHIQSYNDRHRKRLWRCHSIGDKG